MPPPMSSLSTLGSSASMTASLSETFEPPSTTTYGCVGVAGQLAQHLDLAQHQPAGVVRQQRGHVVDAGVLAVHGAEGVVHIGRRRRRRAAGERGPLGLVLAGLARVEAQVLQQRDLAVTELRHGRLSPSRRRCRWRRRPGSRAARPRRAATGCSVYFGSGAPFGRPRCDTTMTRAPASRSAVIVGRTARIRPSSVISPSVEGDVEVGAHEHAPTRDALGEQVVERPHSCEPTSLTRSTRRLE